MHKRRAFEAQRTQALTATERRDLRAWEHWLATDPRRALVDACRRDLTTIWTINRLHERDVL